MILVGADVAQVKDQGDIPRGVPLPALPDLSMFSLSLVTGALAVAAIVLVQGVGVAESAPNEDGSPSDANADFIAQGTGNLASGFFQGQPVGGSVGPDGAEPSGRGPDALGDDLLGPLDAPDPGAVLGPGRRRGRCPRSPRS